MIPPLWLLKACAVLAVLAALGYQWGRYEHASRLADIYKGQAAAEREARAQDAAERRIEQVRAKRLQENLDAERQARLDVEASARRAVAADVSLRGELARLASRARAAGADPAAASERAAAAASVPVLAGLLEQCSERRTELARYADEARIAGLTCQRSYDGLTEP